MDKKRKADQKRERRAQQKRSPDDPSDGGRPPLRLSPDEETVLGVFRKFLMSPGRMLCFGTADMQTYRTPLAGLTDKGLLVAEKFRGGYSLTTSGFAAMQRVE